MANVDVHEAIEALQPLLRRFVRGDYGLALGGAHAKGKADAELDLDLFLFGPLIEPDAERSRLAAEFAPEIGDVFSVSGSVPFVQAETDFTYSGLQVECWIRDSRAVEQTIDECCAGIIRRDFVVWTIGAFYNHCLLADLSLMAPVDDPVGMLSGWKERTRRYPPELRAAIIKTHLNAARFWPHNFQYPGAIARLDAIYCAGSVQQVVHHLIQVVFAANEVYFAGDKKLAEALRGLPAAPAGFVERIEGLLYPAGPLGVALLEAQQRDLQRLLADVEGMLARLGIAA